MNNQEEKSKDGGDEKFCCMLPIIKLSNGYYESDLYEPIENTFDELYESEVSKSELKAILEAENEENYSEGYEALGEEEFSCKGMISPIPKGYYECDIYESVEECDRDSHEPIDCLELGDSDLIEYFHELNNEVKIQDEAETEGFDDNGYSETVEGMQGDYDGMQYYCRDEVEPEEKNHSVCYNGERFVPQAEYESQLNSYPSDDDMAEECQKYQDMIVNSCSSEAENKKMADSQTVDMKHGGYAIKADNEAFLYTRLAKAIDGGYVLNLLKRHEEVIKTNEEELKNDPQFAGAWNEKGYALAKLKRYEQVIEAYDEALKINPQYSEAWINLGYVFKNLGRYTKAIKAYDETLKNYPQFLGAWNKRYALNELKKYDEAIKAYDEALKIDPQDAEAWIDIVYALDDLDKYNEAIKAYDEALKIDPEFAEAWIDKVQALNKLKRYEQAIKAYDEALKIDPNDAWTWIDKSTALSELERYDEAIEAYDEALKIYPEFVDNFQYQWTLSQRNNKPMNQDERKVSGVRG